MTRLIVIATVTFCVCGGSLANAQQCDPSGRKSCCYDYYRNKMWPAPFTAADTNSVVAIFEQQRSNGWRLHNTISSSMYDPQTNRLTDAGKAQVKWIVTQAPQDRRVVFVLQDVDQRTTAIRVESTQLAISEMVPVGPLPQIYLTDRDPAGSPGVYQTAIYRAMANSVPSPRLTSQSGGAATGSTTP